MKENVLSIISDVIKIPINEISFQHRIVEDLQISSLEIVIILCKIEETFGISIDPSDIPNVSTIEGFVEWLHTKYDT